MTVILFANPTTDLFLTGAILALVLMAAAIVVALMGRWSKSRAHCEPSDPHAEMTNYRLLRESGQISAAEFERVRQLMQLQIRKQLGENPTQADLERAAMWLTPIAPLTSVPEAGEAGVKDGSAP